MTPIESSQNHCVEFRRGKKRKRSSLQNRYVHEVKTGDWFLGILVKCIPEEGFKLMQVCRAWHNFIMRPIPFTLCAQRWLNLRCVAIQQAAHKDVEARYAAKIEFTQDLDSNFYEVHADIRKQAWEKEKDILQEDHGLTGTTTHEIIKSAKKKNEEFIFKLAKRLAYREYPEDAPNRDITLLYPSLPKAVHVAMLKIKSTPASQQSL